MISATMGICPQHDVLWDQLTGMEHLILFAGLRGVPTEGGAIHAHKAPQAGRVVGVQSSEPAYSRHEA